MNKIKTKFPDHFLWGASSSAFQIEGGWDEGGKGPTVADINSFKRSHLQADSKVASDFFHHWKEDIALMKEMGLNIYRFPLPGQESYQMATGKLIRQESIFIMMSLTVC